MIRVLLVDDQQAVLDGLRMRFTLESDLEVVGVASDGATALRLVDELNPDVVVMDAFMPGMDGIAATIEHRRNPAACPVIVLSLYDDPFTRRRALAAGASAFVGKPEQFEILSDAVHTVHAGMP